MSDASIDELIEGLFGPDVCVAGKRLDTTLEPSFLFEEEAALVEGAIAKRRVEFAAGRQLAHEQLGQLGARSAALPVGADRAPLWPAETTGSITHTAGLCLVAVARVEHHAALGLDVEVTAPLKPKLWPSILTISERALLEGIGSRGALLSKVYFSAKESVYKSVSKAAGRVLEFQEVELKLSLVKGSFSARFVEGELAERLPVVGGRWRVTRDFIVTSAWPE